MSSKATKQPITYIILAVCLMLFQPKSLLAAPKVFNLFLLDANTGEVITRLQDSQALPIPLVPSEPAILAEINGDTQGIVIHINGVLASQDNIGPYTFMGDSSLLLTPVPELRVPGNLSISVQPFAEGPGEGESGTPESISLKLYYPNFVVSETGDEHDYEPGDGVCSIHEPGWMGKLDFLPAAYPSAARGLFEDDASEDKTLIALEYPGQSGRLGKRASQPNDSFSAIPWIPTYNNGCTLRAAIEEANAYPGRQTILVDDRLGTYNLTLGELEITTSMSIAGFRVPEINGQGRSRLFYIDGAEADAMEVYLVGLDIAHGVLTYGAFDSDRIARGGAVYISDASVHISDSQIRDSQANMGGGIYVRSGGKLYLKRSAVYNNVAGHPRGFKGGGVTQRGGGIFNLLGSVYILDSSIYGNLAVRGGGLSNAGGLLVVNSSSVVKNEAVSIGGGIDNRWNGVPGNEGATPAYLHVNFSTIAYNKANTSIENRDSSNGGGIFNSSTAFMSSSILANNSDARSESGELISAPDCYSRGYPIVSNGYNIVGVLNDNCLMVDAASGDTSGIQFGDLEHPLDSGLARYEMRYGNNLIYYEPVSTSIAVDQVPLDYTGVRYEHDMRQALRPMGKGYDIGAIEVLTVEP